ncbi:uncharacterized protein B0H18DRAFT_1124106 [Fomitopsis serialis]|uniref:uncharacterized protein n=1 Tax=Fomitopsis serialis TaxID=139415 RepID=UPI00200875E3|nr:uncharacterized protein B0H18DRAFT_1124106 [Neoantrodia serialis]KAH9916694.1 hypothetical protein B0H18DRAFT_1124106 [Neoantrodia serialis]
MAGTRRRQPQSMLVQAYERGEDGPGARVHKRHRPASTSTAPGPPSNNQSSLPDAHTLPKDERAVPPHEKEADRRVPCALSTANGGKPFLPRLRRAVLYVDSAFDVDLLLLVPRTLCHLDVQPWDEVYSPKYEILTKTESDDTSPLVQTQQASGAACNGLPSNSWGLGIPQLDAHMPVTEDERAAS